MDVLPAAEWVTVGPERSLAEAQWAGKHYQGDPRVMAEVSDYAAALALKTLDGGAAPAPASAAAPASSKVRPTGTAALACMIEAKGRTSSKAPRSSLLTARSPNAREKPPLPASNSRETLCTLCCQRSILPLSRRPQIASKMSGVAGACFTFKPVSNSLKQ